LRARLSSPAAKCQKKLKGGGNDLAKLKKTVNRRNKTYPDKKLTVIGVSCMDLCPKSGVTVCDPEKPGSLSILWSAEDIERIA